MLRLYVAGQAPNSLSALSRARALCAEHFAGAYALEVVDVLKHPARALADGVIVTPTLVKLLPLPVVRVVGNLSDAAQVLLILEGR
ncbi:MAG: circadian clock KaiB family protein [Myxococcota bacterium]